MQRASKTLLVLPGQHIEGEGVLLEIPGFIIDFLAADASKLRVKVVMTCGCPTEPGGMWNADQIAISARITRGGKRVAELPLKFAGETSTYEAAMPQLEAGTYEIEVLAADTIAANFGRAVKTVTIAP